MQVRMTSNIKLFAVVAAASAVVGYFSLFSSAGAQGTKEQRDRDYQLSKEILDLDKSCTSHGPDVSLQQAETAYNQCMHASRRMKEIEKLATDPLIKRMGATFAIQLLPRIGINAYTLGEKKRMLGANRQDLVLFFGIACGSISASAPLQKQPHRQDLEQMYTAVNQHLLKHLQKDCSGIEAELKQNLARKEDEQQRAKAAAKQGIALEEQLQRCGEFLRGKRDKEGVVFDRKITRDNICPYARELGMRDGP